MANVLKSIKLDTNLGSGSRPAPSMSAAAWPEFQLNHYNAKSDRQNQEIFEYGVGCLQPTLIAEADR